MHALKTFPNLCALFLGVFFASFKHFVSIRFRSLFVGHVFMQFHINVFSDIYPVFAPY